MNKQHTTKLGILIALLCLIGAGILFFFLIKNAWAGIDFGFFGDGTRIEFKIDSREPGFHEETTLYTENGITDATFFGKLSVEGSARIFVVSADSGETVFSNAYTDAKAEHIGIELTSLAPYSYYTLHFTSEDSQKAHLLLTTKEAFVKHPAPPKRPTAKEPLPPK